MQNLQQNTIADPIGKSFVEFPRMMYHRFDDSSPKVVRDRKEMEDALLLGWSTLPSGASEEEMLEAKIMEVEGELVELKRKLKLVKAGAGSEDASTTDNAFELANADADADTTTDSQTSEPEVVDSIAVREMEYTEAETVVDKQDRLVNVADTHAAPPPFPPPPPTPPPPQTKKPAQASV